jgi:hypothetical protein
MARARGLQGGNRILPSALKESAKWKRRRLFVRGGETLFESLPEEHYLLFASRRAEI